MPTKSKAPLALSDQALVDRAQPEKLVALKKKDLNELVRTLRSRRDELGETSPDQRRQIVKALRRAADERRARAEDAPPKPKRPGKEQPGKEQPGKNRAEVIAEAAPAALPVAEPPPAEPAPSGDRPGKAEREARKQQKEAERAARKESNKAARKRGKSAG